MMTQLTLGDIAVDVALKDIKNVHLSVYPPNGRVRISAPKRMSLDTIRLYAISRLGWIRQQQRKLQEQQRETPREHLDRESQYVWGERYLLRLVEEHAEPNIVLKHRMMILRAGHERSHEVKAAMIARWYRDQIKLAATDLVAKWEPIVGVKVERVFVQQMKTKWGSCNPGRGSIRLNTDIAKKPRECLEYVIVHEMVHLLERTHNDRFVALMDRLIPQWRDYREQLNRLPVRHEKWTY
jgi:predicted metal-dependent hydrolase